MQPEAHCVQCGCQPQYIHDNSTGADVFEICEDGGGNNDTVNCEMECSMQPEEAHCVQCGCQPHYIHDNSTGADVFEICDVLSR